MLWYKAWLETRARFNIALLGIAAFSSYWVYHGDTLVPSDTRPEYYYSVLHSSHANFAIIWVLAVTLLMMGGLVREKAVGASSFTLALPLSRARLMGVRICVGLLQSMALVLVPWGAMFLIAINTGKAHSIAQAWFHILLVAGGGLLFFAIALLVSTLVEGEYTAPVVSYAIVVGLAAAFADASLRVYSPLAFVMGSVYFDRRTALLMGPVPWMHLAASVLCAAILIGVSVKVIQRREF